MFFHSTRIHAFVLVLIVVSSLQTSATAADPKVKRTSHEVAPKKLAAESASDEEPPRELSAVGAKTPIVQDTAAKDAGDIGQAYSPQWPEPPNTGAMLLRLCLGTVGVLVLCVGTLWFAKPYLKRLQVSGNGNGSLFVEGNVAVGNRAMLYLVRVGETQLVAGVDATGLKSLIALPASFKDVLSEQVPDEDVPPAPVIPTAPPFDVRAIQRSVTKDLR